MALGETRKFKVDKREKKNCQLPGPEIVEIEIKKEQSLLFASTFRMINPSAEAFINCDDGFVSYIKTQGIAENCGIGKILTQLCMNEEKIHNIAGNDKNGALAKLRDYIQECKEREKCRNRQDLVKKLKNLKKWSKSHCSKLIYLEMQAEPYEKAHLYFKSSIASGFTDMFMVSKWLTGDFVNFYPKEGPCPVEMLHEKYSNDGTMIDEDETTFVVGMRWFFCFPKQTTNLPKCTVL